MKKIITIVFMSFHVVCSAQSYTTFMDSILESTTKVIEKDLLEKVLQQNLEDSIINSERSYLSFSIVFNNNYVQILSTTSDEELNKMKPTNTKELFDFKRNREQFYEFQEYINLYHHIPSDMIRFFEYDCCLSYKNGKQICAEYKLEINSEGIKILEYKIFDRGKKR